MLFTVRDASIEDLDALAPLFDAYRQFYGQAPDLALARAYLADRFQHQESEVLVAETSTHGLLGFSQLYPGFSSVGACRAYVLNDLYVVPEARRRGVAVALLRKSAEVARLHGASRLSLSTARGNAAAQRLYQAEGWQRDEEFLHFSLALQSQNSPR
jgi:ribosomal protein S18 acetylase RimI-like enzyme